MKATRIEAFTDGVIAIIITIMVLELKVPEDAGPAGLIRAMPLFAAYALSFVNVGLFWANHHHLFQATERIDGRVIWTNHALLFWLSLVPFVIRWLDEAGFSPLPTAAYGVVLGLAALSYFLLERAIIAVNGRDSTLARAVGRDRKTLLSLVGYGVAATLAFVTPAAAIALYVLIASVWLVPDRRISRGLRQNADAKGR